MSYKTPSYTKVDNDQSANYITPNTALVIIGVSILTIVESCSR